jgi:lipoprotein-releasing system permease protein
VRVWPFFSYFFSYVIKAKTRQRLLFLAMTGLFLSSFSLLVIQGIMGGLQLGLVARSKNIHGSYLILFEDITNSSVEKIKDILTKAQVPFYSELEVEVMLKNKNYVAPAKLHGIELHDNIPDFLYGKDFKGLVAGSELSSKLNAQFFDDIQVIAPGVTDALMGEIPRFVSEVISDYLYTELTEVDDFEAWARIGMVQNLLRRPGINQIRIFGEVSPEVLQKISSVKTSVPKRILSWEDMNEALVWSLNLETKVMLFLFISMSFLVAIAITSGLLIFYTKIRKDLLSFWILGMSQKKLVWLCFKFTLLLSGMTVLLGSLFGFVTLKILQHLGPQLMPDIFVERELPISLEFHHVMIALLIPFGISFIFSYFSFLNFRKENQSFVSVVRGL